MTTGPTRGGATTTSSGTHAPGASTSGGTTDAAKEQTSQVAHQAGQHAEQVADSARQHASQVADSARQQAGDVAHEARTRAGDLTEQARTQVAGEVDQQRDRAAKGLRALADELATMADNSGHSGPATDLAHQAASRAHDLAGYVERHQAGDMIDDVRDFARRKPGTFLIGAALAGIAAGRLTRGVKENKSDAPDGPSVGGRQPAGPIDLREGSAEYAGDYASDLTQPIPTYPYAGAPTDPLAPGMIEPGVAAGPDPMAHPLGDPITGQPGQGATGPGTTGTEGVV